MDSNYYVQEVLPPLTIDNVNRIMSARRVNRCGCDIECDVLEEWEDDENLGRRYQCCKNRSTGSQHCAYKEWVDDVLEEGHYKDLIRSIVEYKKNEALLKTMLSTDTGDKKEYEAMARELEKVTTKMFIMFLLLVMVCVFMVWKHV